MRTDTNQSSVAARRLELIVPSAALGSERARREASFGKNRSIGWSREAQRFDERNETNGCRKHAEREEEHHAQTESRLVLLCDTNDCVDCRAEYAQRADQQRRADQTEPASRDGRESGTAATRE